MDLDLVDTITILSREYNNYKGAYVFSSRFKGIILGICNHIKNMLFLISEFEYRNNLKYVKIQFNTPTFDVIHKDKSAKTVDKLSAIGGTMGLLTGFSIISGVEIIYFAILIFVRSMKMIIKMPD